MNVCYIIRDLARYRKPAVADNNEARFLASADKEVTEHVGSCQHSGIDAVLIVREYPPAIDGNGEVLTVILDRFAF